MLVSRGTIYLGRYAGSSGSYSLGGSGILSAGQVSGGSGTSTFNFNGGTLQAGANSTAFMHGLTVANVQAGAAIIDTQNYNITIAQNLLHDTASGAAATDGGLTKMGAGTLTLSGMNTYNGGTIVSAGSLMAASNGALGEGDVSVLSSAINLSISTGVLDAIADTAHLTLAGGGMAGVADVGYLQLNGNVVTVGELTLGSTTYTLGVFTSLLDPEYISGAGEVIVTDVVPEPGTWTLLLAGGMGLVGLTLYRRSLRV
jgi:fibronectin-binding autotransporter adhesin